MSSFTFEEPVHEIRSYSARVAHNQCQVDPLTYSTETLLGAKHHLCTFETQKSGSDFSKSTGLCPMRCAASTKLSILYSLKSLHNLSQGRTTPGIEQMASIRPTRILPLLPNFFCVCSMVSRVIRRISS